MCGTLETHELGIKAPWVKLEKNKKILLLDLDKTLIYFSHSTGLLLRPFLNYFLNEVKKLYSIYLFTSATKSYVK
jgi:TFIIF-interacting CTD phosphatase-like protein